MSEALCITLPHHYSQSIRMDRMAGDIPTMTTKKTTTAATAGLTPEDKLRADRLAKLEHRSGRQQLGLLVKAGLDAWEAENGSIHDAWEAQNSTTTEDPHPAQSAA